ncbi:MAG: addiction module protein [Deltaproteobacteria bacterium]|nr:addiction module protein [Deltaproteobacteria bacterium]
MTIALLGFAVINLTVMDPATSKLVEEVLRLPREARAAIVGKLIESLDDGAVDANAEAAWSAEIAKRLVEVDSGKVKPVPWDEARRQILSDE